MTVCKKETNKYRCGKDQRRGDQSGQELPCYQQLTPHGSQEVIVQAFFYDLSAEQPGEQAHTAEEDPNAQIEYLECVGQDPRVFFNAAIASHWTGKRVDAEHEGWSKSEQVNPYAAAHPKRLFDLNAKDRCELCSPQLPRKFAERFPRTYNGC